jgi:hypothetical protein
MAPGGLMGSLFGKKPEAPATILQAPTPKPAATMPDETSAAVQEAKRRERMRMSATKGRASTILSAPEGRGGGDSYDRASLGA